MDPVKWTLKKVPLQGPFYPSSGVFEMKNHDCLTQKEKMLQQNLGAQQNQDRAAQDLCGGFIFCTEYIADLNTEP